MARIILITGGSRSGKSEYARKLAESFPSEHVFIAPCVAIDDEMRKRIRKHQEARARFPWRTIEEPVHLADALRNAAHCGVILVDCLTLWVNNVMFHFDHEGKELAEETMERHCRELIAVCRENSGTIIFVTNETGMGIVPENAAARRFRDLAGICNQLIAAAADKVILMACGLPLCLKGKDSP